MPDTFPTFDTETGGKVYEAVSRGLLPDTKEFYQFIGISSADKGLTPSADLNPFERLFEGIYPNKKRQDLADAQREATKLGMHYYQTVIAPLLHERAQKPTLGSLYAPGSPGQAGAPGNLEDVMSMIRAPQGQAAPSGLETGAPPLQTSIQPPDAGQMLTMPTSAIAPQPARLGGSPLSPAAEALFSNPAIQNMRIDPAHALSLIAASKILRPGEKEALGITAPGDISEPVGIAAAKLSEERYKASRPGPEIRDWLLANGKAETAQNINAARQALQMEAVSQEGKKAGARELATPGRAETRERLLAMKVNPGDATPQQWNQAIAAVNEQHIRTAAETGARAVMLKPLDDNAQNAIVAVQTSKDVVSKLLTEFTPQQRAKYAGIFKYPITQWTQYFADDPKFARFTTLLSAAKASAFDVGGKQLTPFEANVVFGYVPTGTEMSPSIFEEKLKYANERFDAIVNNRINLAITPKTEAYKLRPKAGKEIDFKDLP